MILRLGATPVFADIKKDSAVIDENDIKLKISKTKAIIAVSLYGIIPNIREIKVFKILKLLKMPLKVCQFITRIIAVI